MSVKVSVPTDQLVRPEVSQAVQALILALGGRKAAPVTVRPERAAARTPKARPKAAQTSKPARKMTLDEFIASLPPNSRRFIEIVKQRGVIKASEMVPMLGLKNAKAVGGITGAIGRWGPARGVELPYERITLEGERAWRWLADENGKRREIRTAPAVPVTPISFPLPAPAPRRSRKKKQPDVIAKKPVKDTQAHKPTKAIEPQPAATPAGQPKTLDGILASLDAKARQFADALRSAGTLSSAAALDAAGLTAVGHLNALVREINGTARHLGQKLVLDDLDVTGGVSYRWLGLQPPAQRSPDVPPSADDTTPAERVARGGLIRRRRRA